MKYVYLCSSPHIKAALAACGWNLVNSDSLSILSYQFFTYHYHIFHEKCHFQAKHPGDVFVPL